MNATAPLMARTGRSGSRGFTLVEVALAVGIATFALTAMLALVPIALGMLHDSGLRDQWDRLRPVFWSQLNGNGYAKAAAALDTNRALYLYQYLGRSAARADGSWVPDRGGELLQPVAAARWEDDPLLAADLKALTGPLFKVKLIRFPSEAAAKTASSAPDVGASTAAWAVIEQVPSGFVGGAGQRVTKQAVILQP